ncbi:2-hydroxychromene-2-carboxylate isomerase [Vibrio sp. TH_r3]|uniref:2-hydroxychromene-2-carboxylate isomerase n=1 Tax=Vibrio sp. TH_r3 TaxID=3082084 RepID=UPI002955BD6E|nr:2-hydroxychromene-2-carboxylate isomerase [Vibrio sp. TH_r3]MDV7103735.1 2-hydroxychromene-2-carboxylate isomerase [Vibrio sp. TH_r3]
MNKNIDYYFTSLSPFTYLGHNLLLEIADGANKGIHFKPVILGQIFGINGTLPLGERPQNKQQYRLLEIKRWAIKRNLPINLQPAYFPTSPALADKCCIALQELKLNAGQFVAQVLAACWSQEKDIAEESVLHDILTVLELDAAAVIALANSEKIQAIYQSNTDQALADGVLGVPAYYFNSEQFWGQDRLELLNDALV